VTPPKWNPPPNWHPNDDIDVMSVGDESFALLANHFDTLSISEWSHINEDVQVANAGDIEWTQDWELLNGEDEGNTVVEPIVLKGRKKEEEGGRKDAGAEISLTQVGIDELENEIVELEDAVKQRGPMKKSVPSENQKTIASLREQVRKLKRTVEDRENDDHLYRESLSMMSDRDKEDLELQLRMERQRNERLTEENDEYERLIGGRKKRGGYSSYYRYRR